MEQMLEIRGIAQTGVLIKIKLDLVTYDKYDDLVNKNEKKFWTNA